MRKPWLWVAVVLQVAVLAGMIGLHSYTLRTGVPVRLKIEPMDPFDLFRGSYVHMRPSIARLDLNLFRGDAATLRPGDTVYVALQQDRPYWQPLAVSRSPVDFGQYQVAYVAVKGQVQSVDTQYNNGIFLSYSFQDFFTTDERARDLGQRRTGVDVQIRVDRFGNAALDQVFVDGQPLNWQ